MLSTSRPTPPRLDRSTVRFNITRCGSRRIIEHRRKRRYRELLRETPQWNAPLSCIQDDDGDWIIVALAPCVWRDASTAAGRVSRAEVHIG